MSETIEQPPIHPVEVRISIGGDDWEYVQRMLAELYSESRHRGPESFQMFSGGAGGSYSVTTARRDITPEAFHEELHAWHVKHVDGKIQEAREAR